MHVRQASTALGRELLYHCDIAGLSGSYIHFPWSHSRSPPNASAHVSPLSIMSFLAGALDAALDSPQDPSDASLSSPKAEDDLDSVPAPDSGPVIATDEDHKEELNDLFGEDEDVNMVEREYVCTFLHLALPSDAHSCTFLQGTIFCSVRARGA